MNPKHFETLFPITSREKEISEIVKFIREGNSCQLLGIPGSGRSNVLSLLTYNHDIHLKHFPNTHLYIHFVYINFSEVKKRPLVDVLKLMLLAVSDSIRERKMTVENRYISKLISECLPLNDELVFAQYIKKLVDYLSIEKKLTLIFLFDKFEDFIPSVTPEFFTYLRSFRDRAKYRFSIVFSQTRPLEDVLEESIITNFQELIGGHFVYVRLFDPESINFRITYLEKMTDKKLNNDLKSEIIKLSGGHGKITRLAVESVLAHNDNLALKELDVFLLSQQIIRNTLFDIWQSLTPSERDYLKMSSNEKSAELYLEKVGLLLNWECKIPLLIKFSENSSRIHNLEKSSLVYFQDINIIKKGDINISESLTKSEFRILKHFLLNQDIIIDRDEIISIVWKDMESTKGVTDQAIDQLIFRLRKKIENDPNNPQHILTLKGRGFKYTS